MVLKSTFAVALCTGLLALSGLAMADDYRPDEFLGLDLSKAVLSPKRLGPDSEFAPVPVEAKADRRDGAQDRPHDQGDGCERRATARRGARQGTSARRGPRQAGEAARQSARCAGARYADPDLAVQVRRHLQLAAVRLSPSLRVIHLS